MLSRRTLIVVALAARSVHADSSTGRIEACASASEEAQRLASDHQLQAARARLLACARPSCPKEIERDCDQLLSRVDADTPTIVLGAKDEHDRDVTDARVTVDGKPFAATLDGRPLSVDPGNHTFVFDRDHGEAVELVVVVREGEKHRSIDARFAAVVPDAPPRPAPRGRHLTTTSTILGALGITALGAFGYLAITGQHDFDQCMSSGCDASTASGVHTKRWFAWATLGITVAASSSAVYLYATSTADGGSVLGVHGSF